MHINDKSEESDNTNSDYKNQNNNKNNIRVCKEEEIVIINYEKSVLLRQLQYHDCQNNNNIKEKNQNSKIQIVSIKIKFSCFLIVTQNLRILKIFKKLKKIKKIKKTKKLSTILKNDDN